MDTRRRNPELLAAQIQISIPNRYLGFQYKGLFWLVRRKNGQGTHCTKMSADKSTKNNPMPKLSAQKFWILMEIGFIGRP